MNVVSGELPYLHTGFGQWLCWFYTDDGTKQPFSPFSDLPRYVEDGDDKFSWSNARNWTDYDTAQEWADIHPKMKGVGFVIQNADEPYREPADPTVLIDFDDVRDPDTGDIHPYAAMVVRRAGSYADVSVSGTGVHILGVGALPEGVRTVQDELPEHPDFSDAEIEIYDGKRWSAMTGKWIEESNREVADVSHWLRRLSRRFDTTTRNLGPSEPSLDLENETFKDVTVTDNFDKITDAIDSVGPRDIRLRSTEANQRPNGVIDYDPAYRTSKSGTGLAYLNQRGVWVDRDGEHFMDALQLVALEDRIISRPTDYPSGDDFWKALATLRDRGANIPRYSHKEEDRQGLNETPTDEHEQAKQDVKRLEML